ncbi:MAG: tail fiber domain-containing protein, partial [Candidatus Nanohaloarchaea archaeon]
MQFPNGNLQVGSLPDKSDNMCWDGSGASVIGDCSSLRKYKDNITRLGLGLDTVNRMEPVRYRWNESMGGEPGLGFVAESVANVSTLVAEYNNGSL